MIYGLKRGKKPADLQEFLIYGIIRKKPAGSDPKVHVGPGRSVKMMIKAELFENSYLVRNPDKLAHAHLFIELN